MLASFVASESGVVLDTSHDGWKIALETRLKDFLSRHLSEGTILVKTSTAGGGRSSDHEVSRSLLQRTLLLVAEAAPKADLILGDGPAFRADYREECERFGWDTLARSVDASICDLNLTPSREIAPGWPVSSVFLDADVVISLARAKTHRRFGVSLAEKAMLGALSGDKLGYPKLKSLHHYVPLLVELIARSGPPIFAIVDGAPGIEGEGPLEGDSTTSHFIGFGENLLGIDLRVCVEMGFDPILVPSFLRPLPVWKRVPRRGMAFWQDLRVTDVDFLPSKSCAWLYRSLRTANNRDNNFRTLMGAARRHWPLAEPR